MYIPYIPPAGVEWMIEKLLLGLINPPKVILAMKSTDKGSVA